MNQTCYIADDEYHAIERLSDYIAKTPGLELSGSSTNSLRALEEISSPHPPDIVFLDIDMPELSGLELAGLVNSFTTVIITTAYREYALDAFEKQAMDYMLKPISYERFLQAIQKIRKRVAPHPEELPAKAPFFFVKGGIGNKFIRINTADIGYINAAVNYIEIYVKEQMILTYMSMGDVLALLPENDFSRIHKSHIVNHRIIRTLDYGQVTLSAGKVLPIGRAYRKAFHQKMGTSFSSRKHDDPG